MKNVDLRPGIEKVLQGPRSNTSAAGTRTGGLKVLTSSEDILWSRPDGTVQSIRDLPAAIERLADDLVEGVTTAGRGNTVSTVAPSDTTGYPEGALWTRVELVNGSPVERDRWILQKGTWAPVGLDASQIVTGKLDAGLVDAVTLAARIITSGAFRTAADGQRLEITSDGLRAWNASGDEIFRVDPSTGDVDMLGDLRTRSVGGFRLTAAADAYTWSGYDGGSYSRPGVRFDGATGSDYSQIGCAGTRQNGGTDRMFMESVAPGESTSSTIGVQYRLAFMQGSGSGGFTQVATEESRATISAVPKNGNGTAYPTAAVTIGYGTAELRREVSATSSETFDLVEVCRRAMTRLSDTGWTTDGLNLSSGWSMPTTTLGPWDPLRYRILNGIVYVNGYLAKSSKCAVGEVMVTLPAKAAPSRYFNVVGRGDVTTSGQVLSPEASTAVAVTFSFPLG